MNVLLWPALFLLNLICRRQMKRAGWTDEDMAELQRRMLDQSWATQDPLGAAEGEKSKCREETRKKKRTGALVAN